MISELAVIQSMRAGFSETDIANSLGVTPGALTQFIDSRNIREKLAEKSKFEVIDKKYNILEDSVLDKIAQKVKYADLDVMKLTAVLRTVNQAKRRSMAEGSIGEGSGATQVLVNLQLPAHLELEVRKTTNNEVIEVEGRELMTMNSKDVGQLARGNSHEKLPRDISKLI